MTADFNKNVLAVLNAELSADFDLDAFEHVAVWDPEREWIEMRLRSTAAQHVLVQDLGLTVTFAYGEEMRTEVSASSAGQASKRSWPRPASRCAPGGPTPQANSACPCRRPPRYRVDLVLIPGVIAANGKSPNGRRRSRRLAIEGTIQL